MTPSQKTSAWRWARVAALLSSVLVAAAMTGCRSAPAATNAVALKTASLGRDAVTRTPYLRQ